MKTRWSRGYWRSYGLKSSRKRECFVCRFPIYRGESVAFSEDRRPRHVTCKEPAPAGPPAELTAATAY